VAQRWSCSYETTATQREAVQNRFAVFTPLSPRDTAGERASGGGGGRPAG